jgi:hypothetical protein
VVIRIAHPLQLGDGPPPEPFGLVGSPVEAGDLGQIGGRRRAQPVLAAAGREPVHRGQPAPRRREVTLPDLVPGQVVLRDRHVAAAPARPGQRQRRLTMLARLVVPARGHPQRGQLGMRAELSGDHAEALEVRQRRARRLDLLGAGAVLERQLGQPDLGPGPHPGIGVGRTRIVQQPAQPLPTADVPTPKSPPPRQRGRDPQRGMRILARRERQRRPEVARDHVEPGGRVGKLGADQFRRDLLG